MSGVLQFIGRYIDVIKMGVTFLSHPGRSRD